MKDIKYKLKLPKHFAKEFYSMDKDESPYIKFYKWAVSSLPEFNSLLGESLHDLNMWGLPSHFTPDVSAFKLAIKDDKKLKGIVDSWIKRFHYPPSFWSKNKIEQAIAMHNLSIGPSIFYDEDEQPEEGFVYIKEQWFTDNRN